MKINRFYKSDIIGSIILGLLIFLAQMGYAYYSIKTGDLAFDKGLCIVGTLLIMFEMLPFIYVGVVGMKVYAKFNDAGIICVNFEKVNGYKYTQLIKIIDKQKTTSKGTSRFYILCFDDGFKFKVRPDKYIREQFKDMIELEI